ncbi:MAG: hypothetical protein FJZ12_02690 [Candidatus Omnitrophica bacterium]|nr:hypothetical protein [Candidatus Omnitrophota bacterium]
MPAKAHLIFLCSLSVLFAGCLATTSDSLLKTKEVSLQARQIEMRQFDTKDEVKVLSATAAVLQDMGFTLTEVENKLGLIVGSKERDATVPGQVAMAAFVDILAAAGGSSSNALANVDSVQTILVSCVTRKSLEGNKVAVRVTFQRVVFNRMNQISRLETIKDSKIYEGFFEKLSKSIFLEADKI